MKTILFLVGILLVSGCIGFNQPFGTDVISVNTVEIFDDAIDLLIISNAQTIPRSPIPPGVSTTFSFVLENIDDMTTLNDVRVNLFDAPGFSLHNHPSGNQDPSSIHALLQILPSEQRQIMYNLVSSNTIPVNRIGSETTLSYRVQYPVTSQSRFVFPVIAFSEVEKRQRENVPLVVDFTKVHGRGPLTLDAQLVESPYILSGQQARIAFTLRNAGQGQVAPPTGSQQKAVTLILAFPQGLVTQYPEGIFVRTNNNDKDVFTNSVDIPLIQGESAASLLFTITSDTNKPFDSKEIRGTLEYTYELRDSYTVRIEPFGNS